MLRRPTNHPKSAARSVCNQPVSGCKFPPETLKNLIGDVGAWTWRNLLRASWSLCLSEHLGVGWREGKGVWGGRVGSCKGQSSTNMSPHNVVPVCFTHFLLVILDQLSSCYFKIITSVQCLMKNISQFYVKSHPSSVENTCYIRSVLIVEQLEQR